MNRILKIATIPICVCIFLLAGCIDEFENIYPYEKSIASFFDKVQSLEKQFSFDAAAGSQYVSDRGTILDIPPNAFVDASGNLITGMIDFTFIEVLDKSLMMIYDKPTITSSNTILESAGVLYLEARQDGKELSLIEGIEVRIPSDNMRDMRLFGWSETAVEPAMAFAWNLISDVSIARDEWTDPNTNLDVSGFYMSLGRLDWINCDAFINYPEEELTSLCLNFPDGYDNRNTISYVIFEDLNSVIRIPKNNSYQETCFPDDQAPIGERISIVSIRVVDEDQYELGMIENVVITANFEEDMLFSSQSLEQILDILAQF